MGMMVFYKYQVERIKYQVSSIKYQDWVSSKNNH